MSVLLFSSLLDLTSQYNQKSLLQEFSQEQVNLQDSSSQSEHHYLKSSSCNFPALSPSSRLLLLGALHIYFTQLLRSQPLQDLLFLLFICLQVAFPLQIFHFLQERLGIQDLVSMEILLSQFLQCFDLCPIFSMNLSRFILTGSKYFLKG